MSGLGSGRIVPWVVLASVTAVVSASCATVPHPSHVNRKCSPGDREALLLDAIVSEAFSTVIRAESNCVIVALGMEGHADPPDSVMFHLRSRRRVPAHQDVPRLVPAPKIVAVSEGEKCPNAVRTWVEEPACDATGKFAVVMTGTYLHCGLMYGRKGSQWRAIGAPCE